MRHSVRIPIHHQILAWLPTMTTPQPTICYPSGERVCAGCAEHCSVPSCPPSQPHATASLCHPHPCATRIPVPPISQCHPHPNATHVPVPPLSPHCRHKASGRSGCQDPPTQKGPIDRSGGVCNAEAFQADPLPPIQAADNDE